MFQTTAMNARMLVHQHEVFRKLADKINERARKGLNVYVEDYDTPTANGTNMIANISAEFIAEAAKKEGFIVDLFSSSIRFVW